MITYEVKVYENGTKEWWLNGQPHREDGPAIECANGSKEWYLKGNRHREDGPAVEWASGTKEWYLKGKRHREDGPAYEEADGSKSWYLNDQMLTEEEFNRRRNSCAGKVVKIEGKRYRLVEEN